MVDAHALIDDLRAEQEELAGLLTGLEPAAWSRATPAPGWTVADQIAHLAYFDRAAHTALTDPVGFDALLHKAMEDPEGFTKPAPVPPEELLPEWREAAGELRAALVEAPPGTRVPWFGPPMSVPSKTTARLMETWAHGQDVVDALGVRRRPTARLRHVAHLAVRARPFSYLTRELPVPEEPVRVELEAPDGSTWLLGPDEAAQKVTGNAEEFCLVLTRRRHADDTSLRAHGALAQEWLEIGQAFAGPPGDGRRPGQFDDRS
ncbi:TIGR03084 family protein [Nocardiopsis sp. HNM0947]|uniref:TIGR03084 family protein n=1 Tax=Nocardiopsis coralli TaxID=2772213 RepID=A0ABR9P290_9ACTN|nr:TIGR03084 family metal-binding protein [Nocardiopsis coralli]MBE2997944.1 TIGR03084 family protein [Nocardiopsis coralli]